MSRSTAGTTLPSSSGRGGLISPHRRPAAEGDARRPGHRPFPLAPGQWRRKATPYAFLLPGLILFMALMVYPMAQALWMSFYDWSILPGTLSEFIGVENYRRLLEDPVFWRALVNTAIYMVLTVPTQLAIGMGVALLLNGPIRGRTTFRALYYLPVITSWVVVSLVFKYIFNTQAGLVNFLVVDVLGIINENVSWLQERWTALAAISLLGIWKGFGWSMLIFLAGLQDIPKELMEAAELDGASPARRFYSVTLPLLRPVVAFVTVMLVIGGFNVFTSVFLITGGENGTEVVLTYMYEQAFDFLDFGYGSAIAYALTVVIFGLSVIQLRLFRYGQEAA